MKKNYVKPTMEVVEFRISQQILTDSITDINGNGGIGYGGGGKVEPMAPEMPDLLDDDF